MLLRPRQRTFVESCCAALRERGNTLGVAPTGFGKTIVLSAVAGRMLRGTSRQALILQHRQELVKQNATKFCKVNPDLKISIVDADRKSWSGDAVFAMEPTLRLQANMERMPPFDLVAIDEAHHAPANGYQRIIAQVRESNPKAMIFGLTATPNRGDKKALGPIFDNVADQVAIKELIGSGHLVRPRTFVIDLGIKDELRKVRRTVDDFDMNEVAKIMDRRPVTDAVVDHWEQKAGDRQTIIFCSTVAHAQHVADAFVQRGITAAVVHGDMEGKERRRVLEAFDQRKIQVVVNCMVLTEGYDNQPVSCVILLRPCSYKSTMIQCIGRGLRTVDPSLYPGVVKIDCVVLDFGCSTLTHGTLEQDVDLNPKKGRVEEAQAPTKSCPECGEEIPAGCRTCPGCGYEFAEAPASELAEFVMTEIDLLARSSFRWLDLFDDDTSLMAAGFLSWAGIFYWSGAWHAVGGSKSEAGRKIVRYLGAGERLVAMALANDWLNEHESDDGAHKSRRWLDQAATDRQLELLGMDVRSVEALNVSRYRASCMLSFKFNKSQIQSLVMSRNMAVAA